MGARDCGQGLEGNRRTEDTGLACATGQEQDKRRTREGQGKDRRKTRGGPREGQGEDKRRTREGQEEDKTRTQSPDTVRGAASQYFPNIKRELQQ